MVMSGTPWSWRWSDRRGLRPIERTIDPADEVIGGST
jgi:hypothetical protein